MPVSRQKAEDPSDIGASPPLNGHTLDHTLCRHKEYHRFCVLNRKNGTSFEISRERQRSEMLSRKYFDNLRQQQALSGRVDDPRAKDQNGAAPYDTDGTIFDSNKVKLSPSKVDKALKENSRKCEEVPLGDMATVPAMAMHSIAPLPDTRNGFNDLLIKTEPESGGSTPVCLQSPPLSGGAKAPPSSLPFAPPSSGTSNGRISRNFSTPEPKRKCRQGTNSRSSPMFGGKDEIEDDDLKLKPDDFLSTVIRTPPIKPLEEGDDPPITPSPTSVGPPNKRHPSNQPANHSNSVSTSGSTATGSSNGISNSNSSRMDEDLNEFYRVMEQVCEKERLSSTMPANSTSATSTRIDMYSSMSPPPNMVGTQHVISPPPYNSRLPLTAPSSTRYSSGHLPPTLTSPSSPPFSTAHSLFNASLRSQHAPTASLAMRQSQQQPLQATPYPSGPTSLISSQVDTNLQFSDPSVVSQSLTQRPHTHQQTQQPVQHQPQLQPASKPQNQAEAQPHQHRQMHLSHLNHCGETTRQVVAPAPLNIPNTSHVYYNSSQTHQQRMHTSAPSLPPQLPITPTTPLEHYTTFSTAQNAQISPTHGSNPLHHQTLPGTVSYTYSSPDFLLNQVQNPYHQSAPQHQIMQQRRQQQSAAITVSTNSWSIRQQTPQLSFKDNIMTPHSVGRNHINSLAQPQRPGQTEPTLASYSQQIGMGNVSLQQHAPPPPAYMQPCGPTSHPNTATFSRLSFLPNMQ